MQETAYYEIDLGHKKVKFRKWKVRDRKNLKKVLDNPEEILQIMVMNCLEDPNIALSPEELEYLFIKIREKSISESFEFGFKCTCDADKKLNTDTYNISDIIKFTFKPFEEISVKDMKIKFGPVKNIKFYNSKITDSENADISDMIDMILHIESINESVNFTFDTLLEKFLDMDSDDFDEIYEKYSEFKFTIQNKFNITCKNPKCNKEHTFIFDEIPDFFPMTWIKR